MRFIDDSAVLLWPFTYIICCFSIMNHWLAVIFVCDFFFYGSDDERYVTFIIQDLFLNLSSLQQ